MFYCHLEHIQIFLFGIFLFSYIVSFHIFSWPEEPDVKAPAFRRNIFGVLNDNINMRFSS